MTPNASLISLTVAKKHIQHQHALQLPSYKIDPLMRTTGLGNLNHNHQTNSNNIPLETGNPSDLNFKTHIPKHIFILSSNLPLTFEHDHYQTHRKRNSNTLIKNFPPIPNL